MKRVRSENLIFYKFAENAFTVELASYIKSLLYNNNQVVIPGLGVLCTTYKPAEISTSEHTIAPPSKYLVFDGALTLSDGLLAGIVSSQESISKTMAEEQIKEQVKNLKGRLDSGETILLEGIGYFSQENGVIRFDREQEANFLTESFGLSKIDYKPVDYELIPKQNPVVIQPPKKKSYTFAILSFLLILIIGGGIAGYLYYPDIIKKFKKLQQQTAMLLPKKADTIVKPTKNTTTKDTVKQNSLENFFDSAVDKKKALAIPPTDQPSTQPSKPSQGSIYYYIIAGSFKTFERASVLAKQLKKEGFTPEVLQFDEGIFRVSLGEFNDKPHALTELEKIKTTKGTDAVWLLTKKM
jgi:nucleoid DNA-binding protein